ncbi:MAG: hypothetical protein ACLGRW_07590 [Acidobacteriota bacterium]
MQGTTRIAHWILGSIVAPVLLVGTFAAAQQRHAAPAQSQPAPIATAPSEQDVAATQEQLLKLLRMSPTLTGVVAIDPSLLADQEYVSRNNPELAQFLVQHPDVARNPEFYLFSKLSTRGGRRDQALKRVLWPEMAPPERERPAVSSIAGNITGMVALVCFFGSLVFLTRLFVESRRWSRTFKLQSEVHGRLIDKFSATQELAAYMETEAGKRFLEAAPIPLSAGPQQRMPNAVARVLTPLQAGIVLVLLGVGLLLLRHAGPGMGVPMLVLGTVVLMPGVGFILSAGITWVMAGRLGLMPERPGQSNPPFDAQGRL